MLEVRDLTTRFDIRSGLFGRVTGRVHAVERVSFSLARRRDPGAASARSGCGKSTTGRAILRARPSRCRGSVLLDERGRHRPRPEDPARPAASACR
ncbi:hypothetical protein ACU4GA_12090 [Methylobacterium oryzae CBMB20]